MTEPNETALRRRRAQAHLDADPLQAFTDACARYEQELKAADDQYTFDIDRLQVQITEVASQRDQAIGEANEAWAASDQLRKDYDADWKHARGLLVGQPEERMEGQPTVRALEAMIARLNRERNAAVEKVAEALALLERVETFLNRCRRLQDDQGDLNAFRREAATLYSGVGSQRASGPFMASLVEAVRAAAALHTALITQVMNESTKKADLKLGTELAGVPSVLKHPDPTLDMPIMKRRDMLKEQARWDAEAEAARAQESIARTMQTLDLIEKVNRPKESADERRAAAAAKRRDTMQAKKLDAELRKATLRKAAPLNEDDTSSLLKFADPPLIALAAPRWQTPGSETLVYRSNAIPGGGAITVGDYFQSVDGWPAIPATPYEPELRQEDDEKGVIVRMTTGYAASVRYTRKRNGSYEREIDA